MVASAMAEPVMPPIMAARTVLTWARPARRWPASTDESRMSRWVMPDSLRRLPANMKRGMASSTKLCVWVRGSCTGMLDGRVGWEKKKTVPAMPMAKQTGIPMSINMKKVANTSVICQSSCR